MGKINQFFASQSTLRSLQWYFYPQVVLSGSWNTNPPFSVFSFFIYLFYSNKPCIKALQKPRATGHRGTGSRQSSCLSVCVSWWYVKHTEAVDCSRTFLYCWWCVCVKVYAVQVLLINLSLCAQCPYLGDDGFPMLFRSLVLSWPFLHPVGVFSTPKGPSVGAGRGPGCWKS